jgi:hypothetical protein
MLVQADINELGDKRLSPEEATHREREIALRKASQSRIDGQEELEDVERSCGPRIAWQELIRRLQDSNPSLLFMDSQGGAHIAAYRPKNRVELAEHEYDPEKYEWWNDHVYVTGFPKEYMPEWSHVLLDTSLLPVKEIRGWRSVLMAFIKAKAVTYASAAKHFGEPTDSRSGRWHEQLRNFK